MRSLSATFGVLAAVAVAGGCSTVLGLDDLRERGGDGGSSPPDKPAVPRATTASKVDVLLVVDNSYAMSDKIPPLASSIGVLLRQIASKVNDIHVGVVTSSLGSMGGDLCAKELEQGAHLSTVAAGGGFVPGTEKGFLEYRGDKLDVSVLTAGTVALVSGVGQSGCFLPAPLESAYRFLVQPDPWNAVTLRGNLARLEGTDLTVLQQRKAFLRQDSLVLVLLLTDKDDQVADPRSFGGQGWAFENSTFVSQGLLQVARGTSPCAAMPGAATCVSCACSTNDPACQNKASDPECRNTGGYYPDVGINLRFFDMKRRFGVDAQFPIARYADGFTNVRVPDRGGEHLVVDGKLGDYAAVPSCTNPLFAGTLPNPGEELCNLPDGPRGPALVVFGVIGGVPNQLVAGVTPDWKAILGEDPGSYDARGIDPHMIQSTEPRAGLPYSADALKGENGPDPVHGREFTTRGSDLQYACTFALAAYRTCGEPIQAGCDCVKSSDAPLCTSGYNRQVRGKAYPTPRVLRVAKALGERGVVGSICPLDGDGYTSTMNRIADRVLPKLVK